MSGPWHPTGRGRVSARSPQALACCDRCNFVVNRVDLRYQLQWQGFKLQNLQLLVCERCYDLPSVQLKTIIIPADPLPIYNPRPEQYIAEVWSYRATQDGSIRITEDGKIRVVDSSATDPEPPNV